MLIIMKIKIYQNTCSRYLFQYVMGIAVFLLTSLPACVQDPEVRLLYTDNQLQLVDFMQKDTSLTLTVQALEKAGLAATLNTYGPFTFFAPDNQAFRAYFKQVGVKGLADIQDTDLRTVLQYHIVQRKRKAIDFVQGTFPDSTVNGDYFKMDVTGGVADGSVINGKAKVYATNLELTNGILHKVNAVLDPPTASLADFISQDPNFSILAAGMARAGLMDTLAAVRSINVRRPYTLSRATKLKTQLTLFAESNEVFQAAGITAATLQQMPLPELQRLMRYHIVPGNTYSFEWVPSTDYRSLGIPTPGNLKAIMLPTLNYNDFIYYDKSHALKLNRAANVKAGGQDIFVKNGLVQLLDKPLQVADIGTLPRIPIIQEVEKWWYAFGAPVNSNSPRVFGPEKTSNARPAELFAFMVADSPGDSLVIMVPGVQKGKYKIELSYKNGGNRNVVQPVIGGKTTGLAKVDLTASPTYEQKKVISNSFEFKTSGTKRIALMSTADKAGQEIAPDVIVLTPVP
jgi:uncharacterized surface protein with fasciclin (FAS1) repeats